MKALTIRQPWTDAVAYGTKRTENRTRRTTYRGPLLIHAGLAHDKGATLVRDATWPDQRGHILATAQLIGCHQANTTGPLCCAPWGFPDAWHWELADIHALAQPIPAKGQLGLWTPPGEIVLDVLADGEPCTQCTGTDDCHQIGCQPDTARETA